MADEADLAADWQEKWLDSQIREHQYQLNHAVSAFEAGRCKNCNEKLDDGRPYCDEHCRDDHWERIKAAKRNGRNA